MPTGKKLDRDLEIYNILNRKNVMKKMTVLLSLFTYFLMLIASVASAAEDGKSKFQRAVLSGKHAHVEVMLKSGFNADTLYERGETALMMAATYRLSRITELLLKYGADVNKKNSSGKTALMNACGHGTDYVKKSTTAADKLATVKILLDAGADVNAQEKTTYWTPLIYAASDGKNTNIETIELLVNSGADANHKGRYGETALIKAAYVLRYDIVSYLVSKGIDINAVNTVAQGENALFAALEGSTGEAVHFDKRKINEVLESKAKIIRLLLKNKIDTGYRNKLQENAVHLTVKFFDDTAPATLRLLKQFGADFNLKDHMGKTPISIVNSNYLGGNITKKQHQDISSLLKQLGAKPEAIAADMTQLLVGAVTRNNIEEIDEYLSKGADINGETGDGATSLMAAINSVQFMKLVPYLVKKGADINKPIKALGRSSFLFVASYGEGYTMRYSGYLELYKYMLNNGADVNDTLKDGRTPLIFTTYHGDTEALKLLLAKSPGVNIKDKSGMTALMYACKNNAGKAFIEILMKAGCDIHAKNNEGKTALMYAVTSDEADSMRFLLDNGARINDRDNTGMTPLMHAAADYPSMRSAENVRYLLSKGADPAINDSQGLTALDHAKKVLQRYKKGKTDTVDMLNKLSK